jgi:2-haloacid dehalogenase
VADAWRAVRALHESGSLQSYRDQLDRLHRASLDQVLADLAIDGLTLCRDEFTRLGAPASVARRAASLAALAISSPPATLSNGSKASRRRDAVHRRRSGLSAEDFKHYKPDREVYLGAAAALGLAPDQVVMVAAHKPDLAAARAAGLRTAFVERPLEKGPSGGADRLPDPESDLEATDFIDLARQLETRES